MSQNPAEGDGTTPGAPAQGQPPVQPGNQPEVDYKKLSDNLQKELGQAQHTIVEVKSELKEAKKGINPEEIATVVQTEVQKALAADRTTRVSDTIDEEIARTTQDPERQKFIRQVYNDKVSKTGLSRAEIASDIANAIAIADAKVNQARQAELAHAAANKPGQPAAGGPSGGDFASDAEVTTQQFSEADLALMQRYNIDPKKVPKP